MPFSMCEKLDLGEMRPTSISLQLANRSMRYPMGVLEDVPIKVGDLHVSVDFVILEMEEGTRTPIILGRPFLATAESRIDVRNGNLSFDVGDDHVEFNLLKAAKFPSISDEYNKVDIIDGLIQDTMSNLDSDDHLEYLMLNNSTIKDVNPEGAKWLNLWKPIHQFRLPSLRWNHYKMKISLRPMSQKLSR